MFCVKGYRYCLYRLGPFYYGWQWNYDGLMRSFAFRLFKWFSCGIQFSPGRRVTIAMQCAGNQMWCEW